MAFLSWRDQYRVEVEHIDQEHRFLFDLINEFHNEYRGGADRRAMEQVFNRLLRYSEEHFAARRRPYCKAGIRFTGCLYRNQALPGAVYSLCTLCTP